MPSNPESIAQEDMAFMRLALQQADAAAAAGEVPVGAVVVRNGVVIGSGHNSPLHSHDPTAHAEINALRAAAQTLANYRLDGCTLYVTLEPCAMCCGAMLHARLQRVVYGAAEPKTGCAGSVLNLFAQAQLNHQTQVHSGLLAQDASQQMQSFFRTKRQQQQSLTTPLRDDALRTPERFFEALAQYPWPPCYVSDLPSLAGLRMHYLDLGTAKSGPVLLCLHPIPGWSFSYRSSISAWLEQGARVVLPDLIGFGKSDKPKREGFHVLAWHVRCLLELIERLDLHGVSVVVPYAMYPLAQGLSEAGGSRIQDLQVRAVESVPANLASDATGLAAPYPDAGHRAAERAFANLGLR